MGNEAFCGKHGVNANDEKWKVVFEELTEEAEGDSGEPFRGQICPLCYLSLRDRVRDLKRSLKIESREAITHRQENDRLRHLLDVVVESLKQLTGKDAYQLATQKFPASPLMRGMPGVIEGGHGDLLNILPNLITEAASKGAKK